ncbi:hypothetical protein [Pseudomonas nitroreducens]|uniref:hypothetical protein n=1 Tax=Pseudomonas nitroreducens TaxID=46680 RepID=UPI002657DDD5|nr:hypothetical protein [Pseudomonas nitroreducens]MCP1650094.1 hypothetical protein [Pseudomonas nitroreducens]MCP1688037.1 hypothetical protein [Pseudomonas nitroreducens]
MEKLQTRVIFLTSTLLITWLLVLPIAVSLPEPARAIIFSPARAVLHHFEEEKLKFGKACNQSGEKCLAAFIYEGDFTADHIFTSDSDRFRSSLTTLSTLHPEVKTICFNSTGGDNDTAGNIAAIIKQDNFNTCVADFYITNESEPTRFTASCESACVFALLAGKERISIGNHFILGMHSPRGVLDSPKDSKPSKTIIKRTGEPATSYMSSEIRKTVINSYKGKLAVADELFIEILNETARTPPSRMYFSSPNESFELGIFTNNL